MVCPDIRGMVYDLDAQSRLAEAEGLALAIGITIAESFVLPVREVRPNLLFGAGQVDNIAIACEQNEAELVVVDGALTPIQQRNLEDKLSRKVIDRTGLILEIFGERAATAEGRLQVELAHLDYQQSRLVRSWTHLERQRGGFGFLGGPGETQIEADRRMIRQRMGRLRKELEQVRKTRGLHRERRERAPWPVVALVGYTNAGKSTLINRLLGEDRLLTGPEAGITRDSIAIDWDWTDPRDGESREIRLIDTAGMRKKAQVVDKLERLSVADARRAVDFAEVVVLLLDATRGLEAQDLKIASMVLEEGRALMIAINKWDVAEDASALFNGIRAALNEGLAQVRGVPLIAVSAKTGKGLDQMIGAAFELREIWSRRVPTAALNRWFDDALEANPPPAPKGKRIKLRYITQASIRPPRFVVFGTRLDMLPKSYERYLVNGIRDKLGFDAVPVRVVLKSPKNPYQKD